MEYDKEKYERAKKRVEDEKGFYRHLFVFILVNIVLQLFYSDMLWDYNWMSYTPWWVRFTTPLFWGLSLLIHGIYVFNGFKFLSFFKNWEEKKIQEFMDNDEEEFSNRFREK